MKQIIIITLSFIICPLLDLSAQDLGIKNYSLKECIDIALKNNENIKTAGFNIQYQKEIKKRLLKYLKLTLYILKVSLTVFTNMIITSLFLKVFQIHSFFLALIH